MGPSRHTVCYLPLNQPDFGNLDRPADRTSGPSGLNQAHLIVSAHNEACAIVVSFNPPAGLYRNVEALQNQVSQIVIVDNGSSAEHQRLLEGLSTVPRVQVVRNSQNLGVGAALNIGVRTAIDRGFRWVATFDQDSLVGPGFVTGMLRSYLEHPLREHIALVAPRYREQMTGFVHERSREDAESKLITSSMMSGNLVRTDVFKRVGFYNEAYFIDYVDHEFCLRLRRNGYRILRSSQVLEHNLGQLTQVNVGGRILVTTNHSPLRRYYNARNRVLVYRAYAESAPQWTAQDIKSFAKETLKILLLEQEKKQKLGQILKGVWDGLWNRVGRVEDSTEG